MASKWDQSLVEDNKAILNDSALKLLTAIKRNKCTSKAQTFAVTVADFGEVNLPLNFMSRD